MSNKNRNKNQKAEVASTTPVVESPKAEVLCPHCNAVLVGYKAPGVAKKGELEILGYNVGDTVYARGVKGIVTLRNKKWIKFQADGTTKSIFRRMDCLSKTAPVVETPAPVVAAEVQTVTA